MVPQFETCGREIHPEFIQNFTFTYFLRVFFVVWRSLNSLPGLFTVHLNDRPSEQMELCFAFVNLCCFLILFLVSSLKYVSKIFNIYGLTSLAKIVPILYLFYMYFLRYFFPIFFVFFLYFQDYFKVIFLPILNLLF